MDGVEKSQHHEKNRKALEAFILPLDIIPFDDDAARCYGRMRSELEKKGTPKYFLDFSKKDEGAECRGEVSWALGQPTF